MGFVVSFIYVFLTLLSPAYVVPDLAQYRIMNVLAFLCVLGTIVTVVTRGYPWRAPQNLMLALFTAWVVFSWPLRGWLGGMLQAAPVFGSVVIVFFMFAANLFSLTRIRLTAILIIGVALYFAVWGVAAAHWGVGGGQFAVYRMDGSGELYGDPRIRGVGVVEDPNELGQLLIIAISLLGLFWKRGAYVRRLILMLVAAFWLYACYLTHSRGTMVGLTVMVLAWFIQRRQWLLGVLFGSGAMVGMTVLKFSGGRGGVDIQSGADRLVLWGDGLKMFKQSPLLGVGFGSFSDFSDNMTAHNSFILCLAELGLIGSFLWTAALVITFWEIQRFLAGTKDAPECESVAHVVRVLRMALISWATTSWFLSRTYSVTLYILLGMIVAALNIGWQSAPKTLLSNQEAGRPRVLQWAPLTAGIQVAFIVLIYVMIRVGSFLGG